MPHNSTVTFRKQESRPTPVPLWLYFKLGIDSTFPEVAHEALPADRPLLLLRPPLVPPPLQGIPHLTGLHSVPGTGQALFHLRALAPAVPSSSPQLAT